MTKPRWGLYNTENNTWFYHESMVESQPDYSAYTRELAMFSDKGEAVLAVRHLDRFFQGIYEPRKLPKDMSNE